MLGIGLSNTQWGPSGTIVHGCHRREDFEEDLKRCCKKVIGRLVVVGKPRSLILCDLSNHLPLYTCLLSDSTPIMVEDHLEDAEGSPGARTTTKPRARGVSFRGGRASPPKDAPKDTDSPQRRHDSELSRPLSKRTPPPGMISSPTSAATGASGFINRQQLFKRSKSAPLNAAFGSRTQQDRGALPVLKRAVS